MNLSEAGTNVSFEKSPTPRLPRENDGDCSFEANKTRLKTSSYEATASKQQVCGVLVKDDLTVNHSNANSNFNDTNLVADEEGDLFQNQLKQHFKDETEAKEIEILENLHKDFELLEQEQGTLESQIGREYEQLLKDRLSSDKDGKHLESEKQFEVLSKFYENDTENSLWRDISLSIVNSYDVSNHRPVSAMTFR